ncbi:serine/threonine-protein kinase [Oscillatoria acuminata]|uniref:non-specific serine/threonine protein kinase n=1 Tax=Oscillatoria acuminata PCC 6304 TaxID=56110 RepID=K9THZ3_9CYAN|nr:serine/threonine-protein kinase [Oscillatoria acuminata]AFY81746.1 serine/threonine protein kinase [Oscillatoria acuminata PCC 6304]
MQGPLLQRRYQILQPLSQGGFGKTFLAADTQRPNHPHCVVKQLQIQPSSPGVTLANSVVEKAKQLFDQEAAILEKLGNHPQIPRLLAYFEENQQFYLVQELITGHPLSKEIIPTLKLRETEVIHVLQDTLEVLAFVHQQQVIHRDIKPDNLMRRQEDGKLVLIDFGAVKEIRNLSATSGTALQTMAIGTRGYMPNEQAAGRPQFNSDIYALGIIAIQALTGLNPDPKTGGLPQDSTTGEISWRQLAKVSDNLANIIDKMVLQDYRQRYQNGTEALQAILSLSHPVVQPTAVSFPASSGTNSTTQPNQSTFMSILKWPRDHKLGLAGVTVGLVGVITAAFTVPEVRGFMGLDRIKDGIYQDNGIILKYPGDWQAQQINPPLGGDRIVFQSPRDPSSTYQQTITLTIIDLPEPLTPLDYYQQRLRPQLQEEYNLNLVQTAPPTTLDKREANQIVYSTTKNGIPITNKAIWTVKNNTVYKLTYSGESANFPTDQQTVIKKFQDSFKIPD